MDVLMFVMLIIGLTISAGIILPIFISVYLKSRKKGIIFLAIYLLLIIYTLADIYKISVLMGNTAVFIYICFGVLTYFVLRKKRSNRTEI